MTSPLATPPGRSHHLTLALLAFAVAVCLGLAWCAPDAMQGQQGGSARFCSGILAGRSFPIDTSVQPWGPSGGLAHEAFVGAVKDGPLYRQRYAAGNDTAGSQFCGPSGEDGEAVTTLRNELGREPTAEEVADLSATVARCSGRYFTGYWARISPGGTAADPVVVDGPEDWKTTYQLNRVCERGERGIVWHAYCGWELHHRFDWLPEHRPWCDVPPPAVGDRVEVEGHPQWQPGVITRVSGTAVSIRLDAGGSRTEQFADEGRRWRRVSTTPQPTATPTPTATPPAPTPTPVPTVEPPVCPTCPDPPPCPTCKPRCLPFAHGEGLTLRRIKEGRTPSIERLQALVRAIEARRGCWLR